MWLVRRPGLPAGCDHPQHLYLSTHSLQGLTRRALETALFLERSMQSASMKRYVLLNSWPLDRAGEFGERNKIKDLGVARFISALLISSNFCTEGGKKEVIRGDKTIFIIPREWIMARGTAQLLMAAGAFISIFHGLVRHFYSADTKREHLRCFHSPSVNS